MTGSTTARGCPLEGWKNHSESQGRKQLRKKTFRTPAPIHVKVCLFLWQNDFPSLFLGLNYGCVSKGAHFSQKKEYWKGGKEQKETKKVSRLDVANADRERKRKKKGEGPFFMSFFFLFSSWSWRWSLKKKKKKEQAIKDYFRTYSKRLALSKK